MTAPYNILIMGASYGSLLASKLLFGGHNIKLICLPAEAELINTEGFRVRLPVRGRKTPVELDFTQASGKSHGKWHGRRRPEGLRPRRLGDAGAAISLSRGARTAGRCGEVARALHVDHEHAAVGLSAAYSRSRHRRLKAGLHRSSVWDNFDPACITLCSPDPQAIRLPDEKVNVLPGDAADEFQGRALSTAEKHTAILRQLQDEIEAIRFDTPATA